MGEFIFMYLFAVLFGLGIGYAITYHIIRTATSEAVKKMEMYLKEINDKLAQTKN